MLGKFSPQNVLTGEFLRCIFAVSPREILNQHDTEITEQVKQN